MQKVQHHIWLGVWLILVPFLGIPGEWKGRLFALTGLLVIGVAVYTHYMRQSASPEKTSIETGTVSA